MIKKAVILVNVGTPDKPEVKFVRKFLFSFLNDKRVIDLNLILRKILVNLIIVPFRAPKSSKSYKILWTEKGSPITLYLKNVVEKLQLNLGKEVSVFGAMRYGNPSLIKLLRKIKAQKFDEIFIFPLFPHYASSTTGTVFEFVMNEVKNWNVIPKIIFQNQFYSHPDFINIFSEKIKEYNHENFDKIIFSYHGLPLNHLTKIHPETDVNNCSCETEMPENGNFCYKATCYETTRLIAEKLNLKPENYLVSFQSRLTKNWLSPFTDKTIEELAKNGNKKILLVSPAFVADCLETIVEIEHEYAELFKKFGGEELVLVKSLNDDEKWIFAIKNILNL